MSVFGIKRQTAVVERSADTLNLSLVQSAEPVIIKNLVAHWPMVQAANQSTQAAVDYLLQFYNDKPTMIYRGPPSIKGRYFYNEATTALNYQSDKGSIRDMLAQILATLEDEAPPSLYVASNAVDTHFPGLHGQNNITIPVEPSDNGVKPPLASLWIGSRSLASCHYDALENIACCVAGRRRFALFPPEQVENLYPGPLELTPGGQAISMVNFHDPDFTRYPRFRRAIEAGQIAELEPGDGLFIPSMWWHQVEGLSPFNIMMNYWWNTAPSFLSAGMGALLHAILGIRDKPAHEKAAWKALFDYYIFSEQGHSAEHLPPEACGLLGKLTAPQARKLRALLINQLNR